MSGLVTPDRCLGLSCAPNGLPTSSSPGERERGPRSRHRTTRPKYTTPSRETAAAINRLVNMWTSPQFEQRLRFKRTGVCCSEDRDEGKGLLSPTRLHRVCRVNVVLSPTVGSDWRGSCRLSPLVLVLYVRSGGTRLGVGDSSLRVQSDRRVGVHVQGDSPRERSRWVCCTGPGGVRGPPRPGRLGVTDTDRVWVTRHLSYSRPSTELGSRTTDRVSPTTHSSAPRCMCLQY